MQAQPEGSCALTLLLSFPLCLWVLSVQPSPLCGRGPADYPGWLIVSSSVSQTKQVEQAAMVRQSWCRESSRRAWRVTGRWKEQDCSLSLDKLSSIFKPYMTSADGAMSRGGSAPAMPPLKCWEHPSPPRLHTREEEGGSRRRMEAAVLHREDTPNGRLQQTHNS